MSEFSFPSRYAPTLRQTRRTRTLAWVVALSTAALIFDGYDLVVYGTVVPTLLDDPTQLGAISPQQAGALGSYALVGVMVGALCAGAVGDLIGRRMVILVNLAWFSVLALLGAAVTAFVPRRELPRHVPSDREAEILATTM